VVRTTVLAAVVETAGVVVDAGAAVCVCADATVAAQKMKARATFFTRVLDLGEMRAFSWNCTIFGHAGGNRKDRKDYGSPALWSPPAPDESGHPAAP
jgi:hypothetical protein